MPSRRRRTGACVWRDTSDPDTREYSPVYTRTALPDGMLFQRHASASRNQRAFRRYFARLRSGHAAGTHTCVRVLTDCDACILCNKQPLPDCVWENLNRRRGGPVFFFHGEQELRAVLAGGDSFDTVTDNVRKRAEKHPQSLAHGAFRVEVERCERDPIHICDECTHALLWTPVVTDGSMRAENTHTLQLLRNFWERGRYAHVSAVA